MKVITHKNATEFSEESLNALRKISRVFVPIRETVNHLGAEWEVRVNGLTSPEQADILGVNITDPQKFCPQYFEISRLVPSIQEKIDEVSEHFGKPEQVEIEIEGLIIIVDIPTEDLMDAKIVRAEVIDWSQVHPYLPGDAIFAIKRQAQEKAKEYFEKLEKQDELV